MNEYIRDFQVLKIERKIASDVDDCKKYVIKEQNARSLTKHIDEIKILLDSLDQNFDVIVLTETRQLNDVSFLNVKDYQLIYNFGKTNKWGLMGFFLLNI